MNSLVPIQDDSEVRVLTRHITDTVSLAASAVVETAEHDEWATAILAEIARHRKHAEGLRLRFTRPLNESLKAINGTFRDLDGPLAAADKTLRQKVLAYRNAERTRIAEEEARLRAERNAAEAAARAAITNPATSIPDGQAALAVADAAAEALDLLAAPPAPTVKTAFGSSTVRRDWDFEVTDLGLVPTEYLLINGPAVRKAIDRGVRDIPGIRVFQRETLAVRPT